MKVRPAWGDQVTSRRSAFASRDEHSPWCVAYRSMSYRRRSGRPFVAMCPCSIPRHCLAVRCALGARADVGELPAMSTTLTSGCRTIWEKSAQVHHTPSTKAHSSSTHRMGTRSRHGLKHVHVNDKLHECTVHTVWARRHAQRGHTEQDPRPAHSEGTHGARRGRMHAHGACLPCRVQPVRTLGAAAMPPGPGKHKVRVLSELPIRARVVPSDDQQRSAEARQTYEGDNRRLPPAALAHRHICGTAAGVGAAGIGAAQDVGLFCAAARPLSPAGGKERERALARARDVAGQAFSGARRPRGL